MCTRFHGFARTVKAMIDDFVQAKTTSGWDQRIRLWLDVYYYITGNYQDALTGTNVHSMRRFVDATCDQYESERECLDNHVSCQELSDMDARVQHMCDWAQWQACTSVEKNDGSDRGDDDE